MIPDRPLLAAHVKELQRKLNGLSEWTGNPDRPFPGDAVALAVQLRSLAVLMVAGDDAPAGPSAGHHEGNCP